MATIVQCDVADCKSQDRITPRITVFAVSDGRGGMTADSVQKDLCDTHLRHLRAVVNAFLNPPRQG